MIGPTGGNAADQVAELQTLINQKQIHGLAVSSASNDALKPVIAQAYDAGIPIISFNTNNPESRQMGFVGQDLVASGRSLAEELIKVLNGKTGKVVVVSVDSGAGWSNDRFSGFQEGVKDAGLQIVGPVNTGNEPSAAYNTVESTMAAQKDAIALVSLDCCSFTAGAKWLQQSGNAGKIHAVGFDVQPQTVEYLKGGVVDLSISQGPAEQGYQAVKLLAEYLKNGTEIADVDTGALVVTRDNVATVPVEG
ncbi:LacI family transcriptional regulator, partial [Micromonospora fluostatini]